MQRILTLVDSDSNNFKQLLEISAHYDYLYITTVTNNYKVMFSEL